MLYIGSSGFCNLEAIALNIKLLKSERENSDEYRYNIENQKLVHFANVEKIHVVCADGFWQWGGALYEHG
jgi:hypothetical protein